MRDKFDRIKRIVKEHEDPIIIFGAGVFVGTLAVTRFPDIFFKSSQDVVLGATSEDLAVMAAGADRVLRWTMEGGQRVFLKVDNTSESLISQM